MKGRTKAEIVFVLLVFGLIYYVVNNDVSITGFAIQTPGYLEQVSPIDNYETSSSEMAFMFQYSPEIEMKECTLKLSDEPVKTINSLLSSTGTRIKITIQPGEYYWSIECYDMHETRYDSATRRLNVLGDDKTVYTKTAFFDKDGYIYGFDITETLDISLSGIRPNDVLRAKQGKNTYEAAVILISQDYSNSLNFIELMLTPGSKRMRLEEGKAVPIDFNNDGTDELKVKLESVAYRKATLSVKSAQLAEQSREPEQQASPITAPTITITPGVKDNPESATAPQVQSPAALDKESGVFTAINLVSTVAVIILIILIAALSNYYYFRAPKEKKQEALPKTAIQKATAKSHSKRKTKKKAKNRVKSAKNKKIRKPSAAKRPKPKQKNAKKRKR